MQSCCFEQAGKAGDFGTSGEGSGDFRQAGKGWELWAGGQEGEGSGDFKRAGGRKAAGTSDEWGRQRQLQAGGKGSGDFGRVGRVRQRGLWAGREGSGKFRWVGREEGSGEEGK